MIPKTTKQKAILTVVIAGSLGLIIFASNHQVAGETAGFSATGTPFLGTDLAGFWPIEDKEIRPGALYVLGVVSNENSKHADVVLEVVVEDNGTFIAKTRVDVLFVPPAGALCEPYFCRVATLAPQISSTDALKCRVSVVDHRFRDK